MKTEKIEKYIKKSVENFAKSINAIGVSVEQEKKLSCFIIELNKAKIEFVYYKSETMYCPVSTLFCRIYPNKNDYRSYHIPEIIDLLYLNDFHCYYFTFIESEQRADLCLNCLYDFITTNLQSIINLSCEQAKCEEYRDSYIRDNFKNIQNYDEADETEKRGYWIVCDNIYTMSFTVNNAYRAFLNGDYQAALKKYKKKKDLFPYEKRLVEFIESLDGYFEAINPECASMLDVKKYNGSKNDFFALVLSFVLGMVICAIPFVLISVALNVYYSKTAVYYDQMPPLILAILFGGLPGIFLGIVIKERVSSFLNRKDRNVKDFYDILTPDSTMKFARIICYTVFVASVFLFLSIGKSVVVAYDDGFSYNNPNRLFSRTEKFSYNDIQAIYKTEGRYYFEDKYEEGSTIIIKMKDGTLIDSIDLVSENDDFEKEFLPLTGKKIISVHSDRDID
ncbi:MAG: hypothetical protein E7515_08065 [Ruminococcaceae bacterium]|jgi:hypothetical protein|nr:hypothetical protein [Oscillospiraceae bacterium]